MSTLFEILVATFLSLLFSIGEEVKTEVPEEVKTEKVYSVQESGDC